MQRFFLDVGRLFGSHDVHGTLAFYDAFAILNGQIHFWLQKFRAISLAIQKSLATAVRRPTMEPSSV